MYGRSALIVCLAMAGLLASGAQAQDAPMIHYGVRGGVNLANLSVDDLPSEESTSMRTAFQAGGVLEYDATENVAVGAGVIYNMKGAKWEWSYGDGEFMDEGTGKTKLTYVSIPVTARVSFGKSNVRPFLKAGPQVSVLLSAKHSSKGSYGGQDYDEEVDIKDETKSTEFGVVAGGGVTMPLGGVTGMAEVGYDLGLSDINDSGDEEGGDSATKTGTIYLVVGIMK